MRICDPVSSEMVYIGRKDTSQAKVNSQRLELDEIAYHLSADPVVQHAVVVLPKDGLCAKRLVAVLALRGLSKRADRLEGFTSKEASRLLIQAQHRLSETVPLYMIPTTQVLNVDLERIGLTTSFLYLGGNSITAMQVMARCRSQGMTAAVSDTINAKSVDDLAFKIQIRTEQGIETAAAGMGKNSTASTQTHFNQSVLVRVANNHGGSNADPQTLAKGVNALVQTHPMLRARFRLDDTRRWRQRSTRYKRMQASQKALNITRGPLIAADYFVVSETGEAYLFVTVHRLVVDIVS
ncbi:hypothetical protein QBC39DRAFT_415520 [Podospora conica]|nr:hypothetical protein QBC39DRAFT_415520 [Schizothecium conicum]